MGFNYEYQNDHHEFVVPQEKNTSQKSTSLSGNFLNHLFALQSFYHLKDEDFFFTPFIGLELGLLTYSSLLVKSIGKPIENITDYQRMILKNFSIGIFSGISIGFRIHIINKFLSLKYLFNYQFTTTSFPFKAKEYEPLTRETFGDLLKSNFVLNHSGLKMNLILVFYPHFK